jgi:hypothetical protein
LRRNRKAKKTKSIPLPPELREKELISLAEMMQIEGSTQETAWIVAEDQVVKYLVAEKFSQVTLRNIEKGVDYRFLVSKSMRNAMATFLEKTREELKGKNPKGGATRLGRIEMHAIDSELMKLVMPGCLFDPGDTERGCAFFRSIVVEGNDISFHWTRLSRVQHTDYLHGFEFAWPPDPEKVSSALGVLTLFGLVSALMLGAAGWHLLNQLPFEPHREIVWSLLLGGAVWLGLLWLMTLHSRVSIVRRLAAFRFLETQLGGVAVGLVLGVLGNFLTDWLKQ